MKNKTETRIIQIENLTPPNELLRERYFVEQSVKKEKKYLYVSPNIKEKVVLDYENHSFIGGMYEAYAQHRPYHLSPDIIWLLICQGFTKHVNLNSEALREKFVNHLGKEEITVRNDALYYNSNLWAEVIGDIFSETSEYVKGDTLEILTPNYSTTDSVSKLACQITILASIKEYFDYKVISIICGIPWVQLDGKIDDWIKIKQKAEQLLMFNCEWWISKILPVLDKIIDTVKGEIDNQFWMNMFKVHTQETYGGEPVDGWICNFFPYYESGRKTGFDKISIRDLPSQIVAVPLKWIVTDGLSLRTNKLELKAGFFGLNQCSETYKLEPNIGWCISTNCEILQEGEKIKKVKCTLIDEFPKYILDLKKIDELEVSYAFSVRLPDEINKLKIKVLKLNGAIERSTRKAIQKKLPKTELCVNGHWWY